MDTQEYNWELYLARPFDLFGASVWDFYYTGETIEKYLGIKMTASLYVESPRGMANHFRKKGDIPLMKLKIGDIARNDAPRALEILNEGLRLNEKISQLLETKSAMGLQEAIDFLIQLSFHSIVFPMFAGEVAENDEVIELCKKLREVSYYPRFIAEIIIPAAKGILKEKELSEEYYSFLTVREILSGKFEHIEKRKNVASEQFYMYSCINEIETVDFTDDSQQIINKLDPLNNPEIKGVIAYKGKVKGKVRLVIKNDSDIPFDEGDILVSISTNPQLVPLMKKSAAMITDEGGMMCHAAILSREMKIPCIVGTKNATRILKDGQMVEVNADLGVVKILD